MSAGGVPDPARSAVLVVDLQNDFLDADGAYARGGVADLGADDLVERVAPLLAAARAASVPVVFSQFTLVAGRDGAPLVAEHLRRLRPFLEPGDFAPGSWGQRTVAALGPADLVVEKVAYSAFAHTRLDWWLKRVGVSSLVVCGIVTNGGVASTVREAHVRDYEVAVVGDGCAAFDPAVHDATVISLGSVAPVLTVDEVVTAWAAR